jgi:hypothetical protein
LGEKIPVIDTTNYTIIDREEYLVGIAIEISKLREKRKRKMFKLLIKETSRLKDLLKSPEFRAFFRAKIKYHLIR